MIYLQRVVKRLKKLAFKRINRQMLTDSREIFNHKKKNSGDNNGLILTVIRKVTKILTVSRESHHPFIQLSSVLMLMM